MTLIEKKKSVKEALVSAIGSGWIDIYRSDYRSSLNLFKDLDKVLVAKDEAHAQDLVASGKPCVMVIPGASMREPILWACPYTDKGLQKGMFGGSFVYVSNDVVMKGHSSPIRLMDRFE